jgi:hypothetical protein
MNPINGTFRNGQVVLEGPVDWPEGCPLCIAPKPTGASDSDAPETPEQIEEWLRWYHALEPLEFTPEEEAALTERRQKKKEHGIAKSQLLPLRSASGAVQSNNRDS